jgi:hypothetical protein
MNGFGEHDHIIDFIVELRERLKRLEEGVGLLVEVTSERFAEFEERLARLEEARAGEGRRGPRRDEKQL